MRRCAGWAEALPSAIVSIGILAAAAQAADTAAPLPSVRVAHLRCEYRIDPLGIDETAPRLQWQLMPRDVQQRGIEQKSYQILAATTREKLDLATADLWDSGIIASDQSSQVVYGGKALTSRMTIWWKVRVWDQNGIATDWSEPATWSMGLLDHGDWSAKWIGKDETADLKRPDSPYWNIQKAFWIQSASGDYEKSFDIPRGATLTSAVVVLAAQEQYELTINGIHADRGSRAWMADVIQAAPWLHAVTNVIHVHITAPAATSASSTGAAPVGTNALLAAIKLVFADGSQRLIVTDGDWGASVLGPYGAPGLSKYNDIGFSQEHYLPARYLRKDIDVSSPIRRATAYICGLGLFELHVNGAKVSDDVLSPALSQYDQRVLYRTYDLTGILREGGNAMGVILGNGRWWSPRLNKPTGAVSFGYPKLLVQVEIEYADGTTSRIVSDESWKLTTDGPLTENNEYDGEEYDATQEMTGWDEGGFDDRAWQPASLVAAPAGAMRAQMSEPMRVVQTLHPVAMTEPFPGIYIFDMGQNMVGWCRLNVRGDRGTHVTMRYAERLTPQGYLMVDNLRTAKATDDYTLSGGAGESWEPRFTYHGFRYVQVEGLHDKPPLNTVDGRVVSDNLEDAGMWRSSSNLLNQIQSNIYWGLRGNYRSIPTDCPQRDERQGWLGDRAQVQLGETYEFNVAAFYSKWLTDIADTQRPDGMLPSIAPAYWQRYPSDVTWPSTLLCVAENLRLQYGDDRMIRSLYPVMTKWMDTCAKSLSPDGLTDWAFYGDWCMPPESPDVIHSQEPGRQTDKTLLGTTYWCDLCRKMSRFAALLGKTDDAAKYAALADKSTDGLQRKFYNPQTGLYSNGSQTSSVLPLGMGITPPDQRQRVVSALVDRIHRDGGHLQTGVLGTAWIMRALTDNGHADTAYEIASQKSYPGWGYMIDHGATTFWELWNGDTADPAMNSGNHVMLMGDLATWMYEDLAGIRPDTAQPGFKHIIFHPMPLGDLTWVSATHRCAYGTISVEWQRDRDRFVIQLSIPANTTATLEIPARDGSVVTESNKPAAAAEGVHFEKQENGLATYSLTSGDYSFESALP